MSRSAPSGTGKAAQALVGRPLRADTIAEAADLAAQAAQPKSDHRGSASYKRHIIHTFIVRILTKVEDSAQKAA